MKINICDFCGEPIQGDPIKIIPYFLKEDFEETICIPWSEQVNRTYCRKCTADLISLMRMPVETMKKLEQEKGRRLIMEQLKIYEGGVCRSSPGSIREAEGSCEKK